MKRSPYLKDNRLADVIAALQIMGATRWAKHTLEIWDTKLGVQKSGNSWKDIFEDHPEFFSVDGDLASLRWRYAYDRTYDIIERKELTEEEIKALGEDEKIRVTRKPLASEQIETLIRSAIELHGSAIAHEQEKRWLTPLLFALLGIILGAVLQAALK